MDNILDFMAKFNNETAREGAAEVSTIDANKRWKSDPISKAGPAYNFGVVKIRCKINGECPMWQAPRKEILLTFNKKTIKSLSEKARQGLDAVEGGKDIEIVHRPEAEKPGSGIVLAQPGMPVG